MSERNGNPTTGTNTAEIPVVRTGGASSAASAPGAGEPAAVPPVPAPATAPSSDESGPTTETAPNPHATAPVTVRPAPRMPRRGPLTVMGPWAPVAGGLIGLGLGLIAALVLAGAADTFEDRLALVFAVVGLGTLGVSGTLLADEVRMVRQGAREAAVRPAYVEVTAGLLNGLTPARLLLLVSAFVLFLSAYVSRG